ncbi:Transcriptional regulator, MarR family [Arthrobacter sp. PAMC 25486]|uniref:MarR family winged helix-turn-helix transcriptional regulator n=1 Tax=Arthrobacter sp. PAMC 25486 TaxID=1494608 RepID=UPI000535BA5E|nr:MarR family transcriptional regulator [Arthrobacter sp. PAMC 25486]AIY02857.1 Transcriptional regulator, MarR family [Arthrobacter sp. PAMC 25486]
MTDFSPESSTPDPSPRADGPVASGLGGRKTGKPIGVGALAAELRVAIMRTSRRLRAEAATREISPGQYSVLAGILASPLTVGQLAAREQIQAPSMTRIVNALDVAGFVGREENPQDKRQVLVRITEPGAAALLRARSKRTAWLAKQVAALTPQERATLHEAAMILQEMSA